MTKEELKKKIGEILDDLGRQALTNYNGSEPIGGWMIPTRALHQILSLIQECEADKWEGWEEEFDKKKVDFVGSNFYGSEEDLDDKIKFETGYNNALEDIKSWIKAKLGGNKERPLTREEWKNGGRYE